MISFERFTLENGLKVIVHEDHSTPYAIVNTLFDVGARDENIERTGFAHLFEHLMFGGSKNAPKFDEPLEKAGGRSNAFTNNDITNYYDIIPAENIETALWLESDRLLNLNVNQHSLDVQRKVVSEEFKEHYINQPYGDVWHEICKLSYTQHPYQWPTIGLNLKHVEDAKLADVQAFFDKHYVSNNAILVIAGKVKFNEIKTLVHKWYDDIPMGKPLNRNIKAEPKQTEKRTLTLKRKVPVSAIFKSFHMCKRSDKNYYAADLLTDLLAKGQSSRLYQKLVKEKALFSEINAYVTENLDEGLILIEGMLLPETSFKIVNQAIEEELALLCNEAISDNELEKIKNQVESTLIYDEMSAMNKAMNLAFFELLGDADMINHETELFQAVSKKDLQSQAKEIFTIENSNTIYYEGNVNA